MPTVEIQMATKTPWRGKKGEGVHMLDPRISLGLRPSDEREHTAKGSPLLQFPAFSSHCQHQGIKKSKGNKKKNTFQVRDFSFLY